MYLSFYGLADKPFSITPDPRYLFLGGRHAEALAHLLYGITDAGGFIQLTGEVGTGKTTVIRSLLAKRPDNAEIALILNPRLDARQFLQTICEELGVHLPPGAAGNLKELIDLLNSRLLSAHAAGRRVVVIVDEAQNLAPEVLEQVRLLTNLETETQKLLQIILIGQPELRAMLERNDMRQLAQRITGRYHLEPLNREESTAYLRHRLRIAGATQEIFTRGALNELYRVSGGVPRLLNVIGDRALLGGYTEDRHVVNGGLVRRAASEVSGHRVLPGWLPWLLGSTAVMLVCMATALLWHRQQATLVGPGAPVAEVAVPPGGPAPEEPPAPTAEPKPDLLTLLQQSGATTDARAGFAQLFWLWQAEYAGDAGDACLEARRQGLDCLYQSGGLETLRRYNRPALLELADAAQTTHQAVVAHLGPDTAHLLLGDALHEVPLAELEPLWNGDFLLLWRPLLPEYGNLTTGMRGAAVQALRQRLLQAMGLPAAGVDTPVSDPEFFDESLRQLVMEFQRTNGLVEDGVAGSRTRALLDAQLAATDTPLLSLVIR